ncbi:hypothetical protein E2C01_069229 [Portunus trituberculatus]|uniref:Secreted protein n=1 Tax=Portunus trituberculatus TaxID=210409 RepID=A0A5B7HU04_PORTR|nr:hypothetical protein [Portunus trituberculatus]
MVVVVVEVALASFLDVVAGIVVGDGGGGGVAVLVIVVTDGSGYGNIAFMIGGGRGSEGMAEGVCSDGGGGGSGASVGGSSAGDWRVAFQCDTKLG